jgi:hypothetical protein
MNSKHLPIERFHKVADGFKSQNINIVDVLCGSEHLAQEIPLDEELHFPINDIRDEGTGAQCFLHRHAADVFQDSIHIHFFQRWKPPELALPDNESITTHLAALDISRCGKPLGWFTVNQWVVGDYWQSADSTLELFKKWDIQGAHEFAKLPYRSEVFDWLRTIVELSLLDPLPDLLNTRDQILDQLIDKNPNTNVLQDKTVEVLSYKSLNL